MSIVRSEITSITPYGSLSIQVNEEHEDHLGKLYHASYIANNGYDTAAKLSSNAVNIHNQTVASEIDIGIGMYLEGKDPLHVEVSENNWQKIVPDYQTWDELASEVTIHFLENHDQLYLVHIETTIIRISTTDKTALWGMTVPEVSDVNADIQTAINTKDSLGLYSPHFVNGVKV